MFGKGKNLVSLDGKGQVDIEGSFRGRRGSPFNI